MTQYRAPRASRAPTQTPSLSPRKALDDILEQLSRSRVREDAAKLIELCVQGRNLAMGLGDRRGELILVTLLSSTHDLMEDYARSYEFALEALNLATQQREIRDEIEIRTLMSTALHHFGLAKLARDERERVLRLVDDLRDTRTTAAVTNRIALDMLRLGELEPAQDFVNHSLRLTEFMQSFPGRSSQLHTAALVALANNCWDDAARYLAAAARAQSLFPSRRWDAELAFVAARHARAKGERERALEIVRPLPAIFEALHLPARAATVGLFALELAHGSTDPDQPRGAISIVEAALAALRKQEHARSGQLVMRLSGLRREVQEVPRLRNQLLDVELSLLDASLTQPTGKRPLKTEMLSIDQNDLLAAIEDLLATRKGPITVARIAFDVLEACTYEPLTHCRAAIERAVARPVRLMARSPAIGYFLINNTAHRRVHAALAGLRAAYATATANSDATNTTTHILTPPCAAALVVHRRLDVSAIELLSRLDKLAAKTPVNSEPAPNVLRLR